MRLTYNLHIHKYQAYKNAKIHRAIYRKKVLRI